MRGYGDVLWRALSAAEGEILVFLESGAGVSSVPALVGPLLEREELALVKGFRDSPGELSEIVARPLINLHHPELAGFVEPLSKSLAAHRSLLETLAFPVGEGATLSLLLDTAEKAGVDAIAQAHLGQDDLYTPAPASLENAYAIQAAVSRAGDRNLVPGPLFLPSSESLQTRRVPLEERPPMAGLNRLRPTQTGA